jgi:hypothetical protein
MLELPKLRCERCTVARHISGVDKAQGTARCCIKAYAVQTVDSVVLFLCPDPA